jgi:hypothetical protein
MLKLHVLLRGKRALLPLMVESVFIVVVVFRLVLDRLHFSVDELFRPLKVIHNELERFVESLFVYLLVHALVEFFSR